MAADQQGLERSRMSWQQYLDLPDDVRAEWVDGEVVASPRPSRRHGEVQLAVGSLLRGAVPDLVVSPSTFAEDTVRKGPEYAEAGVGQFWVVDPDHRSIDVFTNVEGRWEPLLHLDQLHPTGTVQVGEHDVVPLDLAQVIPA